MKYELSNEIHKLNLIVRLFAPRVFLFILNTGIFVDSSNSLDLFQLFPVFSSDVKYWGVSFIVMSSICFLWWYNQTHDSCPITSSSCDTLTCCWQVWWQKYLFLMSMHHFKHVTRVKNDWDSVSNSSCSDIRSLKPPYVSSFNPIQVLEWGKLALICWESVLVHPQRLHQGVCEDVINSHWCLDVSLEQTG